MSLRRWSTLLGFVIVSLVLSCGWAIWALSVRRGLGISIGISGIFQLLELFIAYGLLRLADWAHEWGLRWYAVKAVYAGGMAVGFWAGGIGGKAALIAVPICFFYSAFALFLYFNDEFFD